MKNRITISIRIDKDLLAASDAKRATMVTQLTRSQYISTLLAIDLRDDGEFIITKGPKTHPHLPPRSNRAKKPQPHPQSKS